MNFFRPVAALSAETILCSLPFCSIKNFVLRRFTFSQKVHILENNREVGANKNDTSILVFSEVFCFSSLPFQVTYSPVTRNFWETGKGSFKTFPGKSATLSNQTRAKNFRNERCTTRLQLYNKACLELHLQSKHEMFHVTLNSM